MGFIRYLQTVDDIDYYALICTPTCLKEKRPSFYDSTPPNNAPSRLHISPKAVVQWLGSFKPFEIRSDDLMLLRLKKLLSSTA
jgi:hypothetical protein